MSSIWSGKWYARGARRCDRRLNGVSQLFIQPKLYLWSDMTLHDLDVVEVPAHALSSFVYLCFFFCSQFLQVYMTSFQGLGGRPFRSESNDI